MRRTRRPPAGRTVPSPALARHKRHGVGRTLARVAHLAQSHLLTGIVTGAQHNPNLNVPRGHLLLCRWPSETLLKGCEDHEEHHFFLSLHFGFSSGDYIFILFNERTLRYWSLSVSRPGHARRYCDSEDESFGGRWR